MSDEALFLVALFGIIGAVLVVGGWFADRWDRAHRDARKRNGR